MVPAGNKAKRRSSVSHTTKTIHHHHHHHHHALKLIHSYLKNRKQRTKIGSTYSPWEEILFRVPQGSTLGPLLFNIFLCGQFFSINETEFASYADDNKPYVRSHGIEDVIVQ